MRKVAISQSNYIPWKGYFDLINQADDFVILDSVQYTRRDWRNRNKIKVVNGDDWITLSVKVKSKFDQKINGTMVSDIDWKTKILNKLHYNYKNAPYYDLVITSLFENCINKIDSLKLSDINQQIIMYISQNFLNINTRFYRSEDFDLSEDKNLRLINITKQVGGNEYISGEAGKCYLDDEMFKKRDIKLSFMKYEGYKEYPQLHGDFNHFVSILDLLFMTGCDAGQYMLHCNKS